MKTVKKECSIWRKNRIASKIILRSRASKLTPRDIKIAGSLSQDREIADYLLDQAMGSITGTKQSKVSNQDSRNQGCKILRFLSRIKF